MTIRAHKLILLFIVSFIFLTVNNNAQTSSLAYRFSEPGLGSNARALGMGNAYVGLSDDFSAGFFNPAGFGLLKRMEFAGGLNYNKTNNTTKFFDQKTDYSNSTTDLSNLSFAFPFPTMRGSLVFAIGYSRDKIFNEAVKFDGYNPNNNSMIQALLGYGDIPYQLYLTDSTGNNTPINGKLTQSGTMVTKGSISTWGFSGAVEIAKNIFVGATLDVFSGSMTRTRDYYEDDLNGTYRNILTDPSSPDTRGFKTFNLNDTHDYDISGWDAKVGVMYQSKVRSNSAFRLGADIKFPSFYTIKENYLTDAYADFATTRIPLPEQLSSNYEYDLTTPYVFSGGTSFNYQGLILSGGVSYIDYTQMEYTDGMNTVDKNSLNKDIRENFRGVLNYNLGAEYTIPEINVRVRTGFMNFTSAYKDDPSDFDKKYFTFGLGVLADEAFAIDAAYTYGWWKTVGDNYGFNESRTFQDVKNHNLIFTFAYRF